MVLSCTKGHLKCLGITSAVTGQKKGVGRSLCNVFFVRRFVGFTWFTSYLRIEQGYMHKAIADFGISRVSRWN